MIVKTRAVRQLARDVKLPEEFIDRYMDELTDFVFRIAKRERKWCRDRIRAWHFSKDIGKREVFQVLDDDTDYDLI